MLLLTWNCEILKNNYKNKQKPIINLDQNNYTDQKYPSQKS